MEQYVCFININTEIHHKIHDTESISLKVDAFVVYLSDTKIKFVEYYLQKRFKRIKMDELENN